eukprot:scaffold30856_cov96-Isochrysis_galbana.AAC.2
MASSSRRRTISASAASAAASRRCRFASDSDRTSAVGYGISRLPGETAPLTAHGRGSEAAVVLPGSGETTIPTKTGDRSGERWPAAGGRSGDTMCSSANGSSTGGLAVLPFAPDPEQLCEHLVAQRPSHWCWGKETADEARQPRPSADKLAWHLTGAQMAKVLGTLHRRAEGIKEFVSNQTNREHVTVCSRHAVLQLFRRGVGGCPNPGRAHPDPRTPRRAFAPPRARGGAPPHGLPIRRRQAAVRQEAAAPFPAAEAAVPLSADEAAVPFPAAEAGAACPTPSSSGGRIGNSPRRSRLRPVALVPAATGVPLQPVVRLGQPKVEKLERAALKAAVGRLQVAVHQAASVHVLESRRNLEQETERLVAVDAVGAGVAPGGERGVPCGQVVVQRGVLAKLHLNQQCLPIRPPAPHRRRPERTVHSAGLHRRPAVERAAGGERGRGEGGDGLCRLGREGEAAAAVGAAVAAGAEPGPSDKA